MTRVHHDGFDFNVVETPAAGTDRGETVLLIHGFASSARVNWIAPGWVKTLTEAGYRTVAFDNRGHGETTKSRKPADYTPEKMAGDAVAVLDALEIRRAHVFGYSMGARIAAYVALANRERAATLILGGLGIGLVEGVGDWDPIAEALLAGDPETVTHPRGRMFRAFADQTKSDRDALAACISAARTVLGAEALSNITVPTLVGVGTKDDIGGSPKRLAELMPDAEAFDIEGRDHMLAVGDRSFKARVLEFLAAHPIDSEETLTVWA